MRARQVQRKVGAGGAGAGAKQKRKRKASDNERGIIDVEFEEEGTDWVVHDVRYEELTDEDGSD